MLKPEQRFWSQVVRPAMHSIAGLYYDRIELKTGRSGVPDVHYTYNGCGWIELKAVRSYLSKPKVYDLSQWAPEQRAWARHQIDAMGKVFLLLQQGDETVLINPGSCYDLEVIHNTDTAVLWRTTEFNTTESKRIFASWLAYGPVAQIRQRQI